MIYNNTIFFDFFGGEGGGEVSLEANNALCGFKHGMTRFLLMHVCLMLIPKIFCVSTVVKIMNWSFFFRVTRAKRP